MKVKDLLKVIEQNRGEYPYFLEWDVYTEQLEEDDKIMKVERGNWETWVDSEEWTYFKCHGFNTLHPGKKIFTINVNY